MANGKLKYLLALAVPVLFAGAAIADDFRPGSVNVSAIKAKSAKTARASTAKSVSPVRALSTLDLSVRIPFTALNRAFVTMSDPNVTLKDSKQPVLVPAGSVIRLSNLVVNLNGIKVLPTVELKPYFEGQNRLAVKITRVDVNLSMSPDKSMKSASPFLDKNEIMAMVMEQVTDGVKKQIAATLAANKVSLQVSDIVSFSYDKETWVEHIAINPAFISPLMPKLLSSLNLTAFAFDQNGITLSVNSGGSAQNAVMNIPGCSLALNDAIVNTMLAQVTAGTNFDLAPEGHPGGLVFLNGNYVQLSGKTSVSAVRMDFDAYFTALMKVTLIAPNTLRVKIENLEVERVGIMPMLSVVNTLLKDTIISSTVDGIVEDKELAKTMTVTKVDDSTMDAVMKPSAMLPSFAAGVNILGLKTGEHMLYISFTM